MIKLKTPLNAGIFNLVKYNQFSSIGSSDANDENEQINKTTIKSDIKQNEILTDKFKKELPYIKEMNKKPNKYHLLEKQISSKTETIPELSTNTNLLQLTNITDTLPIMKDNLSGIPVEELEKSSNKEKIHDSFQSISNSMKIPDLKNKLLMKTNITPIEKSSRLIDYQIVNNQNQLSAQVDLSSAIVPLALHTTENSLLVDPAVQDIRELYDKASEQIVSGCLVMQNQSHLYYMVFNQFLKQPESPQNFLREKMISFQEKSKKTAAIWLCEAKETPTDKKKENPVAPATESPFDKIKKTIDSLLSSLKQKLEEMKKAQNAKKNKEV